MSVLIASEVQSPLGGMANPNLSSDMLSFAGIVGWPPDAANEVSPSPGYIQDNHYPVSAAPRPTLAEKVGSYVDDFYYRVHIIPARLDLGNIASTQTSQIDVWNAWFTARTLDTITGIDEGLSLSAQPDPPLLYSPLQVRSYDVAINIDGPSQIDSRLVWTFDNANAPSLVIVGTRIILWGFAPNWQKGIKELLAWATDILASPTAAEQRRGLRLSPRREFAATMLVAGRARQLLDLSLFAWSGQVWALPVWHQIQQLQTPLLVDALRIDCDTTDREFVEGGLAILQGETAFAGEVAEVLAIDATGIDLARPLQTAWAEGARLFPGIPARLTEQPDLRRHTDQFDELAVNFMSVEANDSPANLPTTLYLGYPVLDAQPNESSDLTHAIARLMLSLDNGTGIPQITDTAQRAFPLRQHRWLLDGRTAQAEFRSLLYGLQGRLVSLWLPTHADDLSVLVDIASAQATVDIANIGYAQFGLVAGAPAPGRRDIRIALGDGTVFYRRITGATAIDADTERLTLDSALGQDITVDQVQRISWLYLCRLDQDSIEIDHITDAAGLTASEAIFRGVRDDEL